MKTPITLHPNQPIIAIGPNKCRNCQADLISQATIHRPAPLEIAIPIRPGNITLRCPFCDPPQLHNS